jgi:hypothetical protein
MRHDATAMANKFAKRFEAAGNLPTERALRHPQLAIGGSGTHEASPIAS